MKAGLIGYGYWGGGFVARNIARVFDLAVIADPDPLRMAEASKVWGPWGVRVVSEPHVVIEDCDAVWIATPVDTHDDLVRRALAEGCHVLCEKPFVTSAVSSAALCALSEEVDRALMVGHLSLFTEAHRRFLVWASNNAGGRNVEIVRHTDRPSLSDHSVLWGLGPHDVASVIEAMGQPDQVTWSGNRHRVSGTLVWDDTADQVTISLDWMAASRRKCLAVRGKDLQESQDIIEPLFAEALEFEKLCLDTGGRHRAAARLLAQQVTGVLAAFSDDRAESLAGPS